MDHSNIPNQQDFLYPTTVEGSESREELSPVEQLQNLYNSPLQYNTNTRVAPSQQVNGFQQVPQMESYTTSVSSNWLQTPYTHTSSANVDISSLIPSHVYTEDSHSISSVSSLGQIDDNSVYSRNKSAASSTSSASSSPTYSYTTSTSKHNYDGQSAASTPSPHGSPSKKLHGDDQAKTRRSRTGCLTCRHRKKRCCETKPKCHECARLGLKCTWPVPGSEHRNKPKHIKMNDGMHYDPFYGNIKILRGIVENRVDITN